MNNKFYAADERYNEKLVILKPNNDRHPERIRRLAVKPKDPLRCSGEARSASVRALRGWFDCIPLRSISLTMTIAIKQDI